MNQYIVERAVLYITELNSRRETPPAESVTDNHPEQQPASRIETRPALLSRVARASRAPT